MLRRLAVSALGSAVLAALAAAPVAPQVQQGPSRLAASGPWLDRLNAWRASGGQAALTENTTWSSGDYNHSVYMVKDDLVTHYEVATEPNYTAAGNTAAQDGNIFVSSSTATSDTQAIDWWMGAPFHSMSMMDPRLSQTGFGSYRQSKSGWDMGATLDVVRGNSFTGGAFPVYFPGNLSSEPLTSYSGNEFPDPLQACPGYGMPTGLPVYVETGGNVTTTVGANSFTGNGVSLAHCVVDSHNSAVGSYLTERGAVLLIPRSPLQPGVKYTVALTVNGVPYTWSFNVGTLGLTCVPGAGGAPTVTSVSPASGSTGGGTLVTVNGCGFNGATSVSFGATPGSGVTVVSDFQITAVTPAEAAGITDVTVTTPSGTSATSAADLFQFTPPGLYTALAPQRVLDTRSGSPLGPGAGINLQLGGTLVPANATSVILNVTATMGTSGGWLTVFPTGTAMPTASNLNWSAGRTVANLVEVNLGSGGEVTIDNAVGFTHVLADLEGYFAPASSSTAGGFVALAPARVTDTRPGSGLTNAGLTLHAGSTLTVQITGAGGVPASGVAAVVLNATVTNTTANSWLTAYPAGSTPPVASNVNWVWGQTVPGRIVVPVGAGGAVSFTNAAGSADLIVDVNGYFTDATASGSANMGVVPSRVLDTRNGTGGVLGRLGPGAVISLTVAGAGGVPAMGSTTPPSAVVINVTVTNATAASWVTIWPGQTTMPTASDLNFVAGQTVANLVVVKLSPAGTIQVSNAVGQADVVIDVVGWFG